MQRRENVPHRIDRRQAVVGVLDMCLGQVEKISDHPGGSVPCVDLGTLRMNDHARRAAALSKRAKALRQLISNQRRLGRPTELIEALLGEMESELAELNAKARSGRSEEG